MKTLINKLLSGFRSSGKKKDPTSEFREYMFGRERRRERRERRLKLLLWTLTVFAVFLAAFIVMTYVFDVW